MTPPQRLLNRNFVLLWQGQFVSQLGSQAFMIAMLFWLKRQTDSATYLGLGMLASALPAVLLSPFGGTFADRHSRRAILITTDLVRGVASLSLGAMVFLRPEHPTLILGWLLATSAVLGICDGFFRPAIGASIPDLVPEDQVTRANALNHVSIDVSTFFGQAAGGVLFRLLGPAVLFLADGATYLFSGLSECFIRIPQQVERKRQSLRRAAGEFLHDLGEGLSYVWAWRGMRVLLFLSPITTFFVIAILVLLPFYVEDVLNVKPDWYGYLVASFGLGAFAGNVVAGATRLEGRLRLVAFLGCSIGFGVAATALGLTRSPWVALALMVAGGAMNSFNYIHVLTVLQLRTPKELRGRVLGVFETLGLSMTPVAAGVTGVVADLLGRDIPLVYTGCGLGILGVALVVAFHGEARRFLSYMHMPRGEGAESGASW